MKKSLLLVGLTMLLGLPLFTSADGFKTITLAPGWNVVSTPGVLSSISYSNGGGGLSFFKLAGGDRQSVAGNTTNIKPLHGFLVNNSNNSNVIMTLIYSPQTVMGATLTNNVVKGRNLLGITDTSSLSAVYGDITVDFTNNGTTNLLNKVNDNYKTYYSYNVANPQIGEAYGVYMNIAREYGGVNNPVGDEISCSINYSTKSRTNQDVVVTIDGCTKGEVFSNNTYTFTENGSHIFNYTDAYGNNGTIKVDVNWIDKDPVICTDVQFSTTTLTNNSVVATLTGCNKTIYGTKTHTFTENGEYLFEYNDGAGNTNQKSVSVDWIDKTNAVCTVNYSPTTPTFGTVTATIECNETMQEPLVYEFTGNGSNNLWLHDLAGNSTSVYLNVNRIKSNLTLAQTEGLYDSTYGIENELVVISGYLTGENKTGSDVYSFSPTYSLHIRNATPNTSVSNIVREAMLARKTNDVYYARCSRTPSGSQTDSNGNADVYLSFSDCEGNENFYGIDNGYVKIAIRLWLGLGNNNSNQLASIYVDDIDKNNISITNGHYDVIGGVIHSRTIYIGRSKFHLDNSVVPTNVNKGTDDVLIYSGSVTPVSNEMNITSFLMTGETQFDNNLIVKLYIGDELIGTKTLSSGKVKFDFDEKTIHNGEYMNFKVYGTFNPSLTTPLEFHPQYLIDPDDENGYYMPNEDGDEHTNINGHIYEPIGTNSFNIQ